MDGNTEGRFSQRNGLFLAGSQRPKHNFDAARLKHYIRGSPVTGSILISTLALSEV